MSLGDKPDSAGPGQSKVVAWLKLPLHEADVEKRETRERGGTLPQPVVYKRENTQSKSPANSSLKIILIVFSDEDFVLKRARRSWLWPTRRLKHGQEDSVDVPASTASFSDLRPERKVRGGNSGRAGSSAFRQRRDDCSALQRRRLRRPRRRRPTFRFRPSLPTGPQALVGRDGRDPRPQGRGGLV